MKEAALNRVNELETQLRQMDDKINISQSHKSKPNGTYGWPDTRNGVYSI
jgi:hypothetical protein